MEVRDRDVGGWRGWGLERLGVGEVGGWRGWGLETSEVRYVAGRDLGDGEEEWRCWKRWR